MNSAIAAPCSFAWRRQRHPRRRQTRKKKSSAAILKLTPEQLSNCGTKTRMDMVDKEETTRSIQQCSIGSTKMRRASSIKKNSASFSRF